MNRLYLLFFQCITIYIVIFNGDNLLAKSKIRSANVIQAEKYLNDLATFTMERDFYKKLTESKNYTLRDSGLLDTRFDDLYDCQYQKANAQHILLAWQLALKISGSSKSTKQACILCGPKGTGKRLFAQAMIRASGQQFIHIQGALSNIMTIEEIQQLFATARHIKNCIIFIEDLDKLVKKQLLNQDGKPNELCNVIGIELKKLQDNGEPIFIIGTATYSDNIKKLFPSYSSVFYESFYLPSVQQRYRFLQQQFKDVQSIDMDLFVLAQKTKGLSYAHLLELCILVKKDAMVQDGILKIKEKNLLERCDTIKKHYSCIRSDENLYKTAIHESAHTIIAASCTKYRVKRVHILEGGLIFGSTQFVTLVDGQECHKNSTLADSIEHYKEDLLICLAGGIGEQEFRLPKEREYNNQNSLSDFLDRTSVIGDIKNAQKAARALILKRDPKILYTDENEVIDEKKLSDLIDQEIGINYEIVRMMIHEKRDKVAKFADLLFEKEIIFEDEIYDFIANNDKSCLNWLLIVPYVIYMKLKS